MKHDVTYEELSTELGRSLAALQTAQHTVVKGAELLGHHLHDPKAHGAAVKENLAAVVEKEVAKAIPVPYFDNTILRWKRQDGTEIPAYIDLQSVNVNNAKIQELETRLSAVEKVVRELS